MQANVQLLKFYDCFHISNYTYILLYSNELIFQKNILIPNHCNSCFCYKGEYIYILNLKHHRQPDAYVYLTVHDSKIFMLTIFVNVAIIYSFNYTLRNMHAPYLLLSAASEV